MNAVDNDQRTALQSAAWQGHHSVVKLLLDTGAHVDHTCNQGATALCIAAQEGHEEVVRVLLRHQANPNHADQFGRTPVRVALKSGHHSVVRILEDFGATPVSCSKSRSSSSNSSSDVRTPAATAGSSTVSPATAATSAPVGCGSGAGPGQGTGSQSGSAVGVGVAGGVSAQHSSPSDSPESTLDRRKSYQSNNSSKSSSNMTTSTNQSTQSGPQQPGVGGGLGGGGKDGGECLTFTQQLQQCSMGKNRSRPISRVLSPVSEPQSPVQSPTVSPVTEVVRLPGMVVVGNHPGSSNTAMSTDSEAGGIGGVTVTSTGRVRVDLGGGKELLGNRPATATAAAAAAAPGAPPATSPALERNLNLLAPSPVKCAASKPEKISATINIITNPNADMLATPEEPVWQMQPSHHINLKASRGPPPPPPASASGLSSPTAPALPPRVPLVDSPNKIMLGHGSAHAAAVGGSHGETRSPEARRKRNGIVTNPKVTKSSVNNAHYNKLSADDKKNGAPKGGAGSSSGKSFSNIQPHAPASGSGGSGRDGNGKAIRPTGLPLKKETPM